MYDMKIRVRYSETDPEGRTRISHILDYFQDVATFHSMSLGMEANGALDRGYGWYLLSWDVTITRYPVIGDSIRVITDPYKMKGFYGYRRFYIHDEQGEVIASADSIWVLMDGEKKLPVRISDELTRLFVDPETDGTVRIKRKLPVKGPWDHPMSFEVTDIFTDSNHHVNNAYYVQWASMVLPPDSKIHHLRVDYRQAAFRGDTLVMEHYSQGPLYRIRFTGPEDVLIAMVDIKIK